MDRLTTKDIVAGVEIFDLKAGICEEKAFNLLGQYEQTGLTPAEVAELAKAKEEFNRLQQENEQLKELLRLAVQDMRHCVVDTGCEVCSSSCTGFDDCEHSFTWQHADKLKELEVISHD